MPWHERRSVCSTATKRGYENQGFCLTRSQSTSTKLSGYDQLVRRSERELRDHAQDLEWFNDQLASRDSELADARKRLAALSQELAEI
jgi:chromosome segregation ATPase